MSAPDTELWAVCQPCNRSFFVASEAMGRPETVMCPVCAEVPERIEQRAGDQIIGVHALTPDALI